MYVGEVISCLFCFVYNFNFSICVISVYYFEIEFYNIIGILMYIWNIDDIFCFVSFNLMVEWEECNCIVMMIGWKVGGVFLWVEIVVNIVNVVILEGVI